MPAKRLNLFVSQMLVYRNVSAYRSHPDAGEEQGEGERAADLLRSQKRDEGQGIGNIGDEEFIGDGNQQQGGQGAPPAPGSPLPG